MYEGRDIETVGTRNKPKDHYFDDVCFRGKKCFKASECVHILMPLRQNVCRQFQVFVVSRLAGFEKSEARGNGVN